MTRRSNHEAPKGPSKGKKYFPPGWNEERVQKVIKYYDSLTEDEWLAKDEAAYSDPDNTMMSVPNELVPAVTGLILEHEEAAAANSRKRRPRKAKARKS